MNTESKKPLLDRKSINVGEVQIDDKHHHHSKNFGRQRHASMDEIQSNDYQGVNPQTRGSQQNQQFFQSNKMPSQRLRNDYQKKMIDKYSTGSNFGLQALA